MPSPYEIQNGVPQGDVFSAPLFLIAINDITKCVYFLSPSTSVQSVDSLRAHSHVMSNWITTKWYRFSSFQTTLVIFERRNPTPILPPLILQNFHIRAKDLIKFHRLTFHHTSIWIHHIKSLKTKCLRSINVLNYLSHPSKGRNRKLLIHLYLSLIHI